MGFVLDTKHSKSMFMKIPPIAYIFPQPASDIFFPHQPLTHTSHTQPTHKPQKQSSRSKASFTNTATTRLHLHQQNSLRQHAIRTFQLLISRYRLLISRYRLLISPFRLLVSRYWLLVSRSDHTRHICRSNVFLRIIQTCDWWLSIRIQHRHNEPCHRPFWPRHLPRPMLPLHLDRWFSRRSLPGGRRLHLRLG